ncbi:MAG TPA: sterol desaturase family protein [Pyrinomonadaceae bacterium]|nr:sterol desaturase family protein [Pyrinomonadaceae bacterium]
MLSRRTVTIALIVMMAILVTLVLTLLTNQSSRLLSLAAAMPRGLLSRAFKHLVQDSILTVPFWIAIAITLALQTLTPARGEQKIFSRALAEDGVWFVYEAVLQSIIIVTYVDLLARLYGKYASFLTVTSLNQLPGWLRFLIAILLVDFLYWVQHYLHHKIPFLWKLHSLHHSQTELNFFTDFRYHVLEYVVRHTVLIIPLLILKIDVPVIAAVAITQRWYSRFYHGNIRTNLGPLRYFLVTPQSHRIHHSIEPQHGDQNFGAIFSIWDFVFGTVSSDFSSYPQTGIADSEFPHRTSGKLSALLSAPLHQMAYPFRQRKRPATAITSETLKKYDSRLPGSL